MDLSCWELSKTIQSWLYLSAMRCWSPAGSGVALLAAAGSWIGTGYEGASRSWFRTNTDPLLYDKYCPWVGNKLKTGKRETGEWKCEMLACKNAASSGSFVIWHWDVGKLLGVEPVYIEGTSIGLNGQCMFDNWVGCIWPNISPVFEYGIGEATEWRDAVDVKLSSWCWTFNRLPGTEVLSSGHSLLADEPAVCGCGWCEIVWSDSASFCPLTAERETPPWRSGDLLLSHTQ